MSTVFFPRYASDGENAELDQLRSDLAAAERRIAQIETDLARAEAAKKDLDDDGSRLRDELAEANRLLAEARADADAKQHEINETRVRRDSIAAHHSDADKELARLHDELKEKDRRIAELEANVRPEFTTAQDDLRACVPTACINPPFFYFSFNRSALAMHSDSRTQQLQQFFPRIYVHVATTLSNDRLSACWPASESLKNASASSSSCWEEPEPNSQRRGPSLHPSPRPRPR